MSCSILFHTERINAQNGSESCQPNELDQMSLLCWSLLSLFEQDKIYSEIWQSTMTLFRSSNPQHNDKTRLDIKVAENSDTGLVMSNHPQVLLEVHLHSKFLGTGQISTMSGDKAGEDG